MKNILYIVVPCYNEEACLAETNKQLSQKLASLVKKKKISEKSRIVYVNDGSKDKTWDIISGFNKSTTVGIKLSKNCGHQNALLAGLMYAKEHADISISIDADLQDDIEVIDQFIEKYNEGCEIVYGVRDSRETDTFFKRNTALMFYKIMEKLGVKVVFNSADYRLMSKRALEELAKFKETNLFLRGIVPIIGFKTDRVYYARAKRFAGETHYPLKKMLNFAWDGITSFSVQPIRMVLSMGVLVTFVSLAVIIYSLVVKILGMAVSGWTFIICSIWLLGGLQMFAIGLIGEYIGKIYSETKSRPRYIIEEILDK